MRRYAFYLSVALLAFGISLIVVFKFYFEQNDQFIITQITETNSVSAIELKENNKRNQSDENKIDEINDITLKNLPCEDQNLRQVWNKIKNNFVNEDFKYLKVHNCNDLFEVVKVFDLNIDKQKEIIVHQTAGCPASGNCTFWVFQKEKNDFQPILVANMIQSFSLKKTQTQGYTDLELRTWNTGFEYYVQLFKFNAGKYKAQECWFETHLVDGEFLKKPKITFNKCGEYDFVN